MTLYGIYCQECGTWENDRYGRPLGYATKEEAAYHAYVMGAKKPGSFAAYALDGSDFAGEFDPGKKAALGMGAAAGGVAMVLGLPLWGIVTAAAATAYGVPKVIDYVSRKI